MENFSISPLSFLALIAPLLTLLISIYYVSKKQEAPAFLLVTGSGIALITSLLYSFLPYYMQSRSISFTEMSVYYTILGGISFTGSIIFIIGFFMLILQVVKTSGNPDKKTVL